MNNGKYHTKQYKLKQARSYDRRFGPIENHVKLCECCGEVYTFNGRRKTKAFEQSKYCSKSCANSIGGKAKSAKYHTDDKANYVTVCWRYHEKRCVVCGEDKIVAVHHNDNNHQNNDPTNLIPLCPTHHQYVHSRYCEEVQPLIEEYINVKWGDMSKGARMPCKQPAVSSILIHSTNTKPK